MEILLVEPNEGDQALFADVVASKSANIKLHILDNGIDALNLLVDRVTTQDKSHQISAIFLELNIPGKKGVEILSQLKRYPKYQDIPKIIFTTSNLKSDMIRSYRYGTDCFVTKPSPIDEFYSVVNSILDFAAKNTVAKDIGTIKLKGYE